MIDPKMIVFQLTAGLGFLLGGWDEPMNALAILILIDFVSAIIAAIKSGNLSSSACYAGIVKKISYVLIIAAAVQAGTITGQSIIRETILLIIAGHEIISIMENVALLDNSIVVSCRRVLAKYTDIETE